MKLIVFLLLAAVLILELNRVFFYYDKTVWSTDNRVKSYRELPEDSVDVLFLGSSNLMSGLNPVQLWEETGIQSYNLCSRAQTFPFAYEYLKDALRTQTPKCVVLDAYSVFSDKWYNGLANSEFHFGINMDNLSLESKLDLLDPYVEKEERLSYIFPLLKNHNYYKTWENTEDVTDQIFMGYCFADSHEYFEAPVYTDMVTPMGETDTIYLTKIIELCQENNIDLYVIKTPVVYSDEEHSVLNGVKQLCEQYQVEFYDMTSDAADWGFNYNDDMLNFFHNNTTGAAKVTTRLGGILSERYDFSTSSTHQYSYVWQEEYDRMVAFRTPAEPAAE